MLSNKPARDVTENDERLETGAADRVTTIGQGAAPGLTQGIRIAGEIRGDQDLAIAGQMEGSIFLPKNHVLIEATAEVHANITARVVEVAGRVEGDLKAGERIVIRSSSVVNGDIVAPKIQLEEGCEFKGSVQMNEPDLGSQPSSKSRAAAGAGGTESSQEQ